MSLLALAPVLLLAEGVAPAVLPLSPDAAASPAVAAGPIAPALPAGTEVELMVTKEVNSRSAKAGDRIKLRVNAPVRAGDEVLIPVGASAWGEVTAVSGTGAAGRSGRLSMRLLHLDTPSGPIPLTGTGDTQGDGNTAGVVLGVLAWGVLGLLNKGDNALFKAGDVIRGYVAAPAAEAPAAGS